MTHYLDTVNSPDDLKNIAQAELPHLAAEIRAAILKKLDATGGHLGSNLGIVEAAIALHYVFDSPRDRIVWDVSHQCYPHKILTGRKDGFLDPAKYNDYSGYTAPAESLHDSFFVGHTSTSVSLALGLVMARDLKGSDEKIIAVIGDGSLTGGEAFEGLNNAAMLDSQFLIVVNDNEMSIAPNHGGVYRNLAELRASKGKAANNFFKTVGLDYLYVESGNDIDALIAAFVQAKNAVRPLVVHIHTFKGKGDAWAEANQEAGHWRLPAAATAAPAAATENYNTITANYLLQKIKSDPTVMVINPATPGAVGMGIDFRKKAGKQFIDVGIAEEHAVALASGLAKNGAKPVLAILGTFLQRTYDQLMQDLCLNNNPATILIYWGGISGASATHSGAFDMSLTGNIPNLICLAPVTKEEYLAMLNWSIGQTAHPVAIRLPREVISNGETVTFDETLLGKFAITRRGQKVAILGLGNFYTLGQKVQALLTKCGIDATVINPRIYSQVDQELLTDLKLDHELIVTLEDGILSGGFGEKVARFYGASDVKVLSFGGDKEFTDRIPLDELYRQYHLTPELIAADVTAALQS